MHLVFVDDSKQRPTRLGLGPLVAVGAITVRERNDELLSLGDIELEKLALITAGDVDHERRPKVQLGDRRLIEATFTITGPSDTNGFVNALPMLHSRYFPSIEAQGPPSMDELVTMKSYDAESSEIWQGDAELRFSPSPTEELEPIAPQEMIGAYYRSVGVTWREGTRLSP